MIDTEGCIFLTEFSVQYVVSYWNTVPTLGEYMWITNLPFAATFLSDGDPGGTSVQKLLPRLGSGEFFCQKIYTLVVVAKDLLS